MFPSFEIFGITIYSYYVMLVVGSVAYIIDTALRAHKHGYSTRHSLIISAVSATITLCAAYIFSWIETGIVTLDGFGQTAYIGAVLVTSLSAYLIGRRFAKGDVRNFVDICVSSLMLARCCIDFGCFLHGCCKGIAVDWGFVTVAGDVARIPAQLVALYFALGIYLFIKHLMTKDIHRGTVAPWTLILYGVARFLIEFIRLNDRILWNALTLVQIWSVVSIAVGVVTLLLVKRHNKQLLLERNQTDTINTQPEQ